MKTDTEILEKAALKASQILHIPVGYIDKLKFVYLYILLYNLMGQGKDGKPCDKGDENMRHWLNTHNKHLDFCPAARLTDEYSMNQIISYLESFDK